MSKTNESGTLSLLQVRKALADWAGDDDWLQISDDDIYGWFGACDTLEQCLSVADENSLHPGTFCDFY